MKPTIVTPTTRKVNLNAITLQLYSLNRKLLSRYCANVDIVKAGELRFTINFLQFFMSTALLLPIPMT